MNDYFLRVFVKEQLLLDEVKANQSSIAAGQSKTDGCRRFIQKWTGFWKRPEQEYVPKKFKNIIVVVEQFLSPAISSLFSKNPNPMK